MSAGVDGALRRALDVLIPVLDVAHGRPDDGGVPAWCEARGWTGFLLALEETALAHAEAGGFDAVLEGSAVAPASLVTLARATAAAVRLPALEGAARALSLPSRRSVPARKELQLQALLDAVSAMAACSSRIVDVGAGHGHFARNAAMIYGRDALGLERDEARVATAMTLAGEDPSTRFVAFDACRGDLVFEPNDLAVGLHACGDVGDRVIVAAGEAACDVALVSCCFQKIASPQRLPLSRSARDAGLVLDHGSLGLANLTARTDGVETDLVRTRAARRARHALIHLLRARGVDVVPGEEMRGQNRRQARKGLVAIAVPAFALRGLAAPNEVEIADAARVAHADFERMRRLALPRTLIARLLEVALVLDRAAALRDRGAEVIVATICDATATPRNLGIFASRNAARLPRAYA